MKPLSLTVLMLVGTTGFAADLPRSTPEAQGVSSKAVHSFIESVDQKIDSFHSVMIVRHGHVITEGWWTPYRADAPHQLFSLSKSFTSTAVGLAIAEGKLSLDDQLVKLFPDDVPANASANLKAMRISDLLRMNTGHVTEPARKNDESWTKTFMSHPVPHKPGTHFLYNTSATYMLSAAVQKVTGQTLLEYLKPRLFEPLGIKQPTWEMSPQGIATGGYGLNVVTEDIAKFGQLYLQKGQWNGKQLIPASWVEKASARQTSNGSNPASDWDQGYGYQFWRSRHGAYRGDGAFGQYCIVMPEQDTVIAITSGVKDMQAVLNIVWDQLLPELKASALPADPESNAKLTARLKSLTIKPESGSGNAPKMTGKTFVFPKNAAKWESLKLDTDAAGSVVMNVKFDGKDSRIVCSPGKWTSANAAWSRYGVQPIATTGAWTSDGVYSAKICYTETPFIISVRLSFSGNEVKVQSESNVGFGATKEPVLTGKSE